MEEEILKEENLKQDEEPVRLFADPHPVEEKDEKPQEEVVEEPLKENLPATTENTSEVLGVKADKDIHFELDKTKTVNEQAKDLVNLAATKKAVEDEELVDKITEFKKEELSTGAETLLKEEQAKSAEAEKNLQKSKYGVYEGIADLIGLKKPLPNGMLKALMFILIPLLIVYYAVVGFLTAIVNVTMDCINAIMERFGKFAVNARKAILSIGIIVLALAVGLVIYWLLHKYGVINW